MSVPVNLFFVQSTTDGNAPLTNGATMTGTTVVYSSMWSGSNRQAFSGQLFWTGTPTGVFVLQFSDKANPDLTTDNDWTADTFVPTAPAGAAGSTSFNSTLAASTVAYRHRIKYTNTLGTGVLTGVVHAPLNG